MKIRALAVSAFVAAAAAASFAASPAQAWECPKNLTRPYYVGGTRVCVPDLNCETCYGVAE